MVPHSREGFEVGTLVFGLAGRSPELNRLTWERFRADEITGFSCSGHVFTLVIPGAYGHAQTQDLDFAGVDGGELTGCSEERDYICAASYAAEVYGTESSVDVLES